jgi:E3 ubiquitin-protein ligase RNF13
LQSMPTEVYTGVLEEGSTSVTCAICIDDYRVGEILRILPCKHSKSHFVLFDLELVNYLS